MESAAELVNLFDYMVGQFPKGSKGVMLGDVERYANNIQDTLGELLDVFSPETLLFEIEDLDEIEDLC